MKIGGETSIGYVDRKFKEQDYKSPFHGIVMCPSNQ